jgi:hypothetical protein
MTRQREWTKRQKRQRTRANRDWRHKNGKRRTRTRITDLSTVDILLLLSARTYCPLCRKRMTDHGPHKKHLDHIVPIAIGGTHTHGNVRVICATCNLSRPYDGSDLVNHAPTLWATDADAAQAAAVLRARQPRMPRTPSVRTTRRQGRTLARKLHADLAYLFRLQGASWADITDRFGFASSGHAHNVVYGGDGRSYAPARTAHFKPRTAQ